MMNLKEQDIDLAEEFHCASRNLLGHKQMLSAHQVHYSPKIQQLVTNAALHLSHLDRVALPEPSALCGVDLETALLSRKSGRTFGSGAMSAQQLSTILHHGNAVRDEHGTRSYPSSGNLGSVEVFPIVMNVLGIAPGIYHFDSIHHDLACLRAGRFARWLREFIVYQIEFSEASVALVLVSSFGRLMSKYGLRGYRMALLDAGHVSENFYLVATALELKVCATAGFIDDELDSALGLDGLTMASTLTVLIGT